MTLGTRARWRLRAAAGRDCFRDDTVQLIIRRKGQRISRGFSRIDCALLLPFQLAALFPLIEELGIYIVTVLSCYGVIVGQL